MDILNVAFLQTFSAKMVTKYVVLKSNYKDIVDLLWRQKNIVQSICIFQFFFGSEKMNILKCIRKPIH